MSERLCPSCGLPFDAATTHCPADGTALIALEASVHDPLLGRKLSDRFQILSRIGSGGMGTVYRARQLSLGRDVAVKVLGGRWADRPEAVRRFMREANLLARVSHPNVVAVLDFGQTPDGLLFLVMELLAGKTLAELLEEGRGIEVDTALSLLIELTRGIEAAHSRGIVHRDLKPANVMVLDDPPGFPKILDFGIARTLIDATQMTDTGKLVGTPHYVAPEVIEGEVPGKESDIYALGVIGYELLAGRRPFERPTPAGVLSAQISAEPAPIQRTIPSGVEAVIFKAMAKDPTARPASAATFRELLLTAKGLSSNTALEAPRPRPRRRALWAALLTAGLTALALAALLAGLDTSEPPTPPAAPEPTAAAAPLTSINLELVSTPPASVRLGSQLLGTTPMVYTRPASAAAQLLVFEQDGYASLAREVDLRASQRVEVQLVRLPKPPSPSPARTSPRRSPEAQRLPF